MRKVAGRLRLDLAQYRELSAFAQFGADLGESVRRQLLRGEKLTEVLKQDDGQPLPVDKEILIVAAGVTGVLDDVPTARIREFETALYAYYEPHRARLSPLLLDPQHAADALAELEQLVAAFRRTVTYDEHQRA